MLAELFFQLITSELRNVLFLAKERLKTDCFHLRWNLKLTRLPDKQKYETVVEFGGKAAFLDSLKIWKKQICIFLVSNFRIVISGENNGRVWAADERVCVCVCV